MKIIDRLPYREDGDYLNFREHTLDIRAYQIIIWVRLDRLIFPAVLDTGHSHNFSIPERHLDAWAGVSPMEQIGEVVVNRQTMPQYRSDLWIQRNQPGTRQPSEESHFLTLEEGITVIPEGMPGASRLPVLGLRAITKNRLRLLIDGDKRQVTLKTKGWF